MSDWLREAGRERVARTRPTRLDTAERLDVFFAEIDARHAAEGHGPTEDWERVKERIAASKIEGLPPVT